MILSNLLILFYIALFARFVNRVEKKNLSETTLVVGMIMFALAVMFTVSGG